MKWGGFGIIIVIVFFVLLIKPVLANPAPPDLFVIVHIDKNGIPYNGSINYSLQCFGHTTKPLPWIKYLRNKTTDDPYPPQLVFDLTNSAISRQYVTGLCDSCYLGYHFWDPEHSKFCLLNGTTENGAFSVWNSSDKPAVNYTRQLKKPYNYYEFYFTLPPDTPVPEMTRYSIKTTSLQKDFYSSLYCSIMQLFGGRCA